jgi:hypothetical protein
MHKTPLFAAAALAACSGLAQADTTILSFSFSDLSGSYSTASGHFGALGVNVSPLQSQGDVSRLNLPSSGSASYGTPGSAAGLINVDLTVSAIVPNSSAVGTGSISIFDADGDSFHADVNGQFSLNGLGVFFNGTLSNIGWTDVGVQDGLLNGPSGGSIPLTFSPAPPPYTGAVVVLQIFQGNFFTNDFSGFSTQTNGVVTPAPASVALLGLGGLFAARRRRA